MGDAPSFKERLGRIDVAVWDGKDGKSGSVSLQRSRKTPEGSYTRETIRFFADEIDNVEAMVAAGKAHLRKTGQYPPKPRDATKQ